MNKNKGIRRFVLFILGCLVFNLSYAQENYVEGYIIKKNSDTLYGFIDYRNWEINPDKIHFKTNIDSTYTSFKPLDIIGFRIPEDSYVSGIIDIEVTPLSTNSLKFDPLIKIDVDTAFLQTLIRGEKSLFYYKNPMGRENFYIENDSGFELLVYKKYLKLLNGKRVSTENNKYLGQLTLYLNDCESIPSSLEKTSYRQNSLTKLFQAYYECSSSAIHYQIGEQKTQTEIGLLAGISNTSLEFSGNFFPHLVNANYKSSTNFSTALFINFVFPRNRGKWSICNEILFSAYDVNDYYEDFENENKYSKTTTQIGYSYLKINNLLRYKYPIGKVSVFINGGFSNGYTISETNYKITESRFYYTESIKVEKAVEYTRKFEQALNLGTGVKYNRFSVEVRYENGNGMANYSHFKSRTKRWYLLFGYKF